VDGAEAIAAIRRPQGAGLLCLTSLIGPASRAVTVGARPVIMFSDPVDDLLPNESDVRLDADVRYKSSLHV
jgi:hypothetical protein